MNIIQCKSCKKLFHSLGAKTCPDCLRQIDLDFITVRDYIYDNPNSRIDKVAKETGVEKATILHLLREGRLTLDNPDAEGLLTCEVCKQPIASGRICNSCKDDVAASMDRSIQGKKPPEPEKKDPISSKYDAKMHTDISRRKT